MNHTHKLTRGGVYCPRTREEVARSWIEGHESYYDDGVWISGHWVCSHCMGSLEPESIEREERTF